MIPRARNWKSKESKCFSSTMLLINATKEKEKGEKMHRKTLSLALAVGLVIALVGAPSAFQDDNTVPGQSPPYESALVTLGAATRGVVFFTAAINSNGSIASCFHCVAAKTLHIGTGTYQIDFGQNVQATNGWSRWVQPDTLTTGSVRNYCDTADRSGDVNAVWVNCQNSAGVSTDTSFFLFVAR